MAVAGIPGPAGFNCLTKWFHWSKFATLIETVSILSDSQFSHICKKKKKLPRRAEVRVRWGSVSVWDRRGSTVVVTRAHTHTAPTIYDSHHTACRYSAHAQHTHTIHPPPTCTHHPGHTHPYTLHHTTSLPPPSLPAASPFSEFYHRPNFTYKFNRSQYTLEDFFVQKIGVASLLLSDSIFEPVPQFHPAITLFSLWRNFHICGLFLARHLVAFPVLKRSQHHQPLWVILPRSRGSSLPACAKSLQSCLTLCDPTDGSPPGSSVHGILQARILE